MELLKKLWPHSAAEQQAASAGKKRKTNAMIPMTMPAAMAPKRKSGVSKLRMWPFAQEMRRMALHAARVRQGSQRRKATFIVVRG
jgi:hypothetical protein